MGSDTPRLSQQSLRVLRQFLDARGYTLFGSEVMLLTKLASGTVYPILFRFEQAGWLTSEWESVAPEQVGRPRRRHYTLTGAGQKAALAALSELSIRHAAWAT